MYDVELRVNLLVVCKIDGVPNGMEVAQGLEAAWFARNEE